MKANELMIGDWFIDALNNKEKVRQIVTCDNSLNDRCYAVIDDVCSTYNPKPIPLTEEILKSNGFDTNDRNEFEIKFSTTFIFRSYVIAYHIEKKNDFIIDVHKVRDDYSSNTVHMVIKYVHELQHALRLCGLNELADNFKID